MHRIPIIRTVYKTCQEVINTIFATKTKSFKQVVLVPFPDEGSYSIGLVTQENIPNLAKKSCDDLTAVFVPTTPNPTSGFLMMFEEKDLIHLDMKIEDAFKYIISCGECHPPFRKYLKRRQKRLAKNGEGRTMKKCFFTGLGILLPIVLTAIVISFLINLLTKPFLVMAHSISTITDCLAICSSS